MMMKENRNKSSGSISEGIIEKENKNETMESMMIRDDATPTTTTQSLQQKQQQQKQQQHHHHQYSGWFHPHKSWKCILVELLLSWLMQLDKLAAKCQKIKSLEQQQQQASSSSEAAASESSNNNSSSSSGSSNSELSAMEIMTQENLKVRNRFGGDDSMVEKALKKWENVAGCPILDESVYIPRCNNLLQAWGLVVNDDKASSDAELERLEERMPTNNDILVKVRFPSSLLVDPTATGSKKKENGTFNLHHLLENNPNVPVVLHFHGGGLTLGNTNDVEGIDLVRGVVQVAQQQQQEASIKTFTTNDANSATTTTPTTTNDSNQAIILVDVEYSLAPEHAFPVAIVEALTVLQYLLLQDSHGHSHNNKRNRNRKIHISGVSAGGLLAAVTTLQGMRRFPGQVASSTLLCPMLDPSCDSNSYRQNATASWLVPTTWLQWCWQVYLYQKKNHHCYSRSNNKSKDEERKEDDDDDDEIIEPIPNLECTNSSSTDTSDTTTDVDSSLDESHDCSDDENVAVSSLSTSKQEKSSLQSSQQRQQQQHQPWWQQYTDGSKLVPGLMSPLWDNLEDVKEDINDNKLPRFLISTNRGDPLHDEGVELVQKLKAGLVGCNKDGDAEVVNDSSERRTVGVQHLDHDGTHWAGTAIDSRQYEELIHAMKDLIFAARTTDAAPSSSSDGEGRLRN